ncbi:MAG: hypothetical protein K9J79_12025 [Desulfobacteraceae bacterium]|nr:hypothetical protein [Desulfobacteraceae bacterium]
MDRTDLGEKLKDLRDLILEERRAAKALEVDEMLELTDQKETLLKDLLPMVDSIEMLSPEEKEMAEAVYSENLRNAYFFWTALNWVRDSVGFIREKISCESYGGSGSRANSPYTGALLSGKV